MGELIIKNNFILSKDYYGSNYAIRFTDSFENTIDYNHDSVLDQLDTRITDLPCWEKYGKYTRTRRLPKFVEGLETVIITKSK